MKRYKFLEKEFVYEALNKVRSALLAARNGDEVDMIINGVLTNDEKLRIGRRIQVAQMLKSGSTYSEIRDELKVGPRTISLVDDKLGKYPKCFELIEKRDEKVKKDFKRKAHNKTGGPKLIKKRTEYTGFKRKDVKR